MINEQQAKRIVKKAEQSIEIVKLVRKGLTAGELVKELAINRQLADYYIKALTIKV